MKGGIPMTTEEKTALCDRHRGLLVALMKYGRGALPLPILRELCVRLGLYPSGQAVNRAARALREAEILDRQTWIDNNSDLLLARKFVLRYFYGGDSQAVATPPRPSTMAPYLAQARKADWLLALIKRDGLSSPQAVDEYLCRQGCTMFLRLPDLLDYYHINRPILAAEDAAAYRSQVAQLESNAAKRSALAKGLPLPSSGTSPEVTLEQAHRRGISIIKLNPCRRAVSFALFAERSAQAERVMDWAVETYQWVVTLLPYYRASLFVYTLDAAQKAALEEALNAWVSPQTSYLEERLVSARMAGLLDVALRNTDFINRWCGGVRQVST